MTTKDEFQVDIQITQEELQEVTGNLNKLSQSVQKVRDLFEGKSADSYCSTTLEKMNVPTRNIAGHLMGIHSKEKDVEVKRLNEEELNRELNTAKDMIKDVMEAAYSLTSQHSKLNSLYENEEKILDKLQEISSKSKLFVEICDPTTKNFLEKVMQNVEDIKGLIDPNPDDATQASSLQDDFDHLIVPQVGQDGNFFPNEVS